jgi:hypothetical protein
VTSIERIHNTLKHKPTDRIGLNELFGVTRMQHGQLKETYQNMRTFPDILILILIHVGHST